MNMAKKMVVKRPPLALRAKYHGVRTSSAMSRVFEKLSAPAPSAGNGAFLIDAYFL